MSFGRRHARSPFKRADESEDKGVDSNREQRASHDQVEPLGRQPLSDVGIGDDPHFVDQCVKAYQWREGGLIVNQSVDIGLGGLFNELLVKLLPPCLLLQEPLYIRLLALCNPGRGKSHQSSDYGSGQSGQGGDVGGIHGACSHHEFTSNRPPQVRILASSTCLDFSSALTARSASYPYQNAPGNWRPPESNSASRPRSRCYLNRFSRLPAGFSYPLGRRLAIPLHSTGF